MLGGSAPSWRSRRRRRTGGDPAAVADGARGGEGAATTFASRQGALRDPCRWSMPSVSAVDLCAARNRGRGGVGYNLAAVVRVGKKAYASRKGVNYAPATSAHCRGCKYKTE